MLGIDEEVMSDVFAKYHLRGPWPFHPVIHHFKDIDRGDPHDHPWGFRSIILSGGYMEQVYDPSLDGSYSIIDRGVGDSFEIKATHIHRIVALPEGECWTLILPGPPERKSGFWKFRDDGPYFRTWDGDWVKQPVGEWK